MATRKRAAKKAVKARGRKSTRNTASRSMNDILIDLGRQYLNEGVRGVLEEHGIDSAVKVELALTKAKPRKAKTTRRAAKKPTRRRYRGTGR